MNLLRLLLSLFLAWLISLGFPQTVWAFCGFYVAQADSSLYNQASQVAIARNGDRTVLTMANDYQGEVKNFALVVPVPVVLKQEQVHVSNNKIIARLDNFSAPRLVEYFDANPCQTYPMPVMESAPTSMPQDLEKKSARQSNLGVTVEAKFDVGEYNIVILSAKESNGLETWLKQNGYKIPTGASKLLAPYIRQNLKFFVAKVNLEKFEREGFTSLRPLSIAYESPKFMLPIRLGTINGKGEQDLIVYLISPTGQTELTNYRTVKIPSDVEIPEYVQSKFGDFYQAMFNTAHQKEKKKVAFVEYAWNMANCDPCSAQPLDNNELKEAGVFWLSNDSRNDVFITRLHIRYTRETFPEDLSFQSTKNQELFQGRYIIRHPYQGDVNCDAGKQYRQSLRTRQEKEAQTLAKLTRWSINDIRDRINFVQQEDVPWWRTLWQKFFSK